MFEIAFNGDNKAYADVRVEHAADEGGCRQSQCNVDIKALLKI